MKIALIGGIGSGKSRVLEILSELGQRVCDCDRIYAQICNKNDYIATIERNFGCVSDGKIDKVRLSEIVFSDKEKLKLLNSLSHHLVLAKVDEIYRQEEGDLYVEVSAFSDQMADFFDEIVFVKSAKSTRVNRVKERDGRDENDILNIMARQMGEEEMEQCADFVILNDSDESELERQTEWVLQWISAR